MSCCGEKRKKLFRNDVSDREKGKNNRVLSDNSRSGKAFIYIGNNSLIITGISGQTYHFRFKGDILNVSAIDQLAFMAERELEVYREQ